MRIMGIKFLNLHMIPWCFRLMGSHHSCPGQFRPDPAAETIKLIKSDGVVNIYHRPILVSDLVLQFPKHLVCHSDSFYIGQKIQPLSDKEQLQLGHKYFLLPQHCFQSVLSFVNIATFASSQRQRQRQQPSSLFLNKVAASCQPFHIQKTPSGSLKIRVSDDFISQLIEQPEEEEEKEEGKERSSSTSSKSRVCTTPQLQKDYTQLVRCGHWKPKLETIRETSHEKRKFSSFGVKKRNKSPSQKTHLHLTCTAKPSPRPKIKFRSRK